MPDTTQDISHARMPQRSPDAIAESMQDQIVLLHVRTEQYYSLDEVGARVWELIDGRRTAGEFAAILQGEYAVEEAVLRADIEELLEDLAANDLIIWAGG